MKGHAILILLCAAAGAQPPAQAQAVWRCGADGRTYSDRPCADGRPLQMAELADTRSAIEVQSAHDVATREKRLAESLRHERLERERLAAPASHRQTTAHPPDRSDGLNPKRTTNKPAAKAPRQAPAADGIWRAVVPASRRAKD